MILYLLTIILCLASSRLLIQSPDSLVQIFNQKYKEEGIPYSIANYGQVPYGKLITGSIKMPVYLKDCYYEDVFDGSNKGIIIMERSECTYTQKSLNAQKQGAKLAIIIDNKVEDPGSVIMIQDGRGSQVHIPTILISKEDGQLIIKALSDKNVIMSLSFDVLKKQRADVQIWIDIGDHKNFIFLRKFKPYFQKLSPYINFSVEFPTKKCQTCSQGKCFYNKKYCSTSSNIKLQYLDIGKEIISQQVRQKILSQMNIIQWWRYIQEYDRSCDNIVIADVCSKKIMGNSLFQIISNKTIESFGPQDNLILRKASQLRINNSILYYPSVVVNGVVYRGNLQPFQVFQLVCNSLSSAVQGCIEYQQPSSANLSVIIIIIVSLIIAFTIFFIFCFRRITRRKVSQSISKQVQQLVNQYITMYQSQKFEGKADIQMQ